MVSSSLRPLAHGVRLLADPEIPFVGEHRPFGGPVVPEV